MQGGKGDDGKERDVMDWNGASNVGWMKEENKEGSELRCRYRGRRGGMKWPRIFRCSFWTKQTDISDIDSNLPNTRIRTQFVLKKKRPY